MWSNDLILPSNVLHTYPLDVKYEKVDFVACLNSPIDARHGTGIFREMKALLLVLAMVLVGC